MAGKRPGKVNLLKKGAPKRVRKGFIVERLHESGGPTKVSIFPHIGAEITPKGENMKNLDFTGVDIEIVHEPADYAHRDEAPDSRTDQLGYIARSMENIHEIRLPDNRKVLVSGINYTMINKHRRLGSDLVEAEAYHFGAEDMEGLEGHLRETFEGMDISGKDLDQLMESIMVQLVHHHTTMLEY